jgi:hypothetical protein
MLLLQWVVSHRQRKASGAEARISGWNPDYLLRVLSGKMNTD